MARLLDDYKGTTLDLISVEQFGNTNSIVFDADQSQSTCLEVAQQLCYVLKTIFAFVLTPSPLKLIKCNNQ